MKTSTMLAYSADDHLSTIRFVRQLTIAVWNCVLVAVVGIVLFEFLDRLLSSVLVRCTSVDLREDDDLVADLSPTLSKSETISAANSFVSSLSQQSREFQPTMFLTSLVVDESSVGNGNIFRDVVKSADPPVNCLKASSAGNHRQQQQQQQQRRKCLPETNAFELHRPRVRFAPTVGSSSSRLCGLTPSSQLRPVNYLDMDSIESNVWLHRVPVFDCREY